jgi:hypothetical protein
VAVAIDGDGMDAVTSDHRQRLRQGEVAGDVDDVIVGDDAVSDELVGDAEDVAGRTLMRRRA